MMTLMWPGCPVLSYIQQPLAFLLVPPPHSEMKVVQVGQAFDAGPQRERPLKLCVH